MAKRKLKKVKVELSSGIKEVYIHGEVATGYLVSQKKECTKLFHITEEQILKN